MKTFAHLPEKLTSKGIIFKMNPELSAKNRLPVNGKKYRVVYVMSKNLKGKKDFFGKPYEPTKWVYTEEKNTNL